jgi:hypothetical protein
VKDIHEIGKWSGNGGEMRLPMPRKEKGLESAIIIQAGKAGPIIGAVKL